ncbi:uncharacterized protein LOC135350422 isoform X1 [Halichondria panicea]|uniref:uncharacterized protein LOC135350422 isoform X1 n=1 Tax=Halichondria panicea TaxID=6063 RepID=UPI00312B5BED
MHVIFSDCVMHDFKVAIVMLQKMSTMNPVLSFILVMIIVLCPLSSKAQEYYVTPTPPPNPDCPADKPCHTLNYYANNTSSLLDSRENVSLLFLDGFHDSKVISIYHVCSLTIAPVSNSTLVSIRKTLLRIQSVSMLSLKSVSFKTAKLELIDVNWYSSQQTVFENSTIFAPSIRSGVMIRNSVFMLSSFVFDFELACNRSDCSRNGTGIEQQTIVLTGSVFDGPGSYKFNLKRSLSLPAPVTSNDYCNISLHDILITGSEVMAIHIEQQYTALFVDVNNCSIHNSTFGFKMVKASKVDVFMTIANSHFSHNGLALFVMSNTDSLETSLLDLTVLHTTFFRNNGCGSISLGPSGINQSLLLENVSIVDSQGNRLGLKSMGASLTVYGPGAISVKDCIFKSNVGVSAFAAIDVDLLFTGNNQFVGNIGIDGGALILIDTTMWLDNGTHINFTNNYAREVGGAIWIKEDTRQPILFNMRTNHYCFYQLTFDLQEPWENQWIPVSITFENNSALAGGDNIFGGSLQSNCKMTPNKQISSFEIASNLFKIKPTMPRSVSSISSSPKRVCLCENGAPVCARHDLILHEVSVTSGERFNLSLAVVGDDFGVVTGSVFALNLNDSEKEITFLNFHKNITDAECVDIEYSVHSVNKNVIILLAIDRNAAAILQEFYTDEYIFGKEYRAQIDQYNSSEEITSFLLAAPVLVNVTILPCPLGMVESNSSLSTCVCDQKLNEYVKDCIVKNGSGLMKRNGTNWIGRDNTTILAHRFCPYCNNSVIFVDIQSPESTDNQCVFNHSGFLCGGCAPGLSLAIGSSRCIHCSNNNGISFFVLFIVVGVAFVLFIKLLDLTVVHGTINGLIFYANIIWIFQGMFFPNFNRGEQQNIVYDILRLVIAWINLDFGIETCFTNGLDAYGKIWLQYVFPVYLWFLAFLIILACRYSPKATQLFGNNAVAVLATMFLFSYVKLIRTNLQAFGPVVLNKFTSVQAFETVELDRSGAWRWLLDANLIFFENPHAFLSVVALLAFFFFCLPYTLLLFFVGWLKYIPFACVSRLLVKFKPLYDTYTGPLKDKHRYWVGLTLLVRLIFAHVLLVFQATSGPSINFGFIVISSAILCILVVKAYKNSYVIALEISLLLNLQILGIAFLSTTDIDKRIIFICVSVSVSFLTLLGVLFFHTYQLVSSIKCSSKCRAKKPSETNNVETEIAKTIKTTTFIDLREDLLVEK